MTIASSRSSTGISPTSRPGPGRWYGRSILSAGSTPCPAALCCVPNRSYLPLDPDELDRAASVYGLMRAHDLWVYEAYYLEGNHRVRQFIRPGSFVPFAEKWDPVASALR